MSQVSVLQNKSNRINWFTIGILERVVNMEHQSHTSRM